MKKFLSKLKRKLLKLLMEEPKSNRKEFIEGGGKIWSGCIG